ncbi:MAG TPA: hypothetical protein PKB06_06165, partial [Actinotalea sp.]|nr:hypothetical protein [Actinotalea sp.]
MWSHAADGWAAWCYHLTSALGLVGLAVTVQRITWGETDARVVVPSVAFGTLMALTAARITTLRVEARTSRRWDRWGAAAALALAAALLAVALLDLRTSPAMAERSEPWTLVVTSWSVPVLMGLLAVLVVGALGLRTTAASAWPLLVVAA